MNWTEGTLARHSRGRARNALIARQKQHFAKARANLLNNRAQKPPLTISFLPPEAISGSPQRSLPIQVSHEEQSTAPSFMPWQADRGRPSYPPSNTDATGCADFEKRRRLLEKSDWAGLHLQEPLHISFPGQIYANRRWTRPLDVAHPNWNQPVTVRRDKPRKLLKKPSMRIRIGSQEIQQSHETSTQQSVAQYAYEFDHHPHRVQRRLAPGESRHDRHSDERASLGQRAEIRQATRPSSSSPSEPETPINVVYSSSLIHEPVPRRDSKVPLQQWLSLQFGDDEDEDDGQSMHVEVEESTRPVPSSQESEQRMWEGWPSNNGTATAPSSCLSRRTESGSSIPLPPHLQLRLPSLDLSSECHNSPEPAAAVGMNTNTVAKERQPHILKNPPFGNEKSHISQEQPDLSDDLNTIWMKFAHGEDSDSDELMTHAFEQAAHQAAVELRPSEPSESAEEGVEELSIEYEQRSDVTPSNLSVRSHVATQGTEASSSPTSHMATIGQSDEASCSTTRFAIPKRFVGKKAGVNISADYGSIGTDVPKRIKRGRRTRRRKTIDGMIDIRNLPDFDGDPIEDD
ncbi:hypothetical protein F5Y17DRAFT_466981 [Xylariaceae sp. FL0594]|nr:hypothetical protein F5Y17DRAFT_466981 [Xylariaceae sp. FL0594]